MVGNKGTPLSAAEPENMVNVVYVQDSHSNKNGMSDDALQTVLLLLTV